MSVRHRSLRLAALLLAAACLCAGCRDEPPAPALNGFELDPTSVPVDEILRGGPPRDGIPALVSPPTVPANEASWEPGDMVLGVELGGETRAYPIGILTWHELVNDELGGRPILVSFCPLCGTALVFDRRLDGETLEFGVSGLVYQSNLLMFDRGTDSLWSQVAARALAGERTGDRLAVVPSRIERWGRWKEEHPDTTVLSRDTGYERDYDRTPYDDYASSAELYFPVRAEDQRYHPKMPVLGLRTGDGRARAYPASELRAAGGIASDEFAGRPVRVFYDLEDKTFRVEAPDDIEAVEAYWFAWVAFHPDTEVFVAPAPPTGDQDDGGGAEADEAAPEPAD